MLERYSKFVREHEGFFRVSESMLQTLVFFLPSRYIENGGAEVWAEAGYSASNLLGVLHDHLLNGHYPVTSPIPPTWARNSIAASMTIAGDNSTPSIVRCRLLLTVISYTEILLEKLASKQGDSEDLVVAIEAIKALLRLIVLTSSSQPLLVDGGKYWPIHVADAKVEHAAAAQVAEGPPLTSIQQCAVGDRPQVSTGRRTGRRFQYIPRAPEPSSPVQAVAVEGESQSPQQQQQEEEERVLVQEASLTAVVTSVGRTMEEEAEEQERWRRFLLLLGEVLHILRPLIYAYCLRTSRRRAWWPFLVSVFVDAVSHQCTQQGLGKDSTTPTALDPLQVQELQRRRALWLLYMLRSPIFQIITDPAASSVERTLSRIPLIRGLASYGLVILRYIHSHYFYISGS